MKGALLIAAAAALILGMAGSAYAASDGAAGKVKSKRCVACHGADGKGKKDNPPLAGMDPAAFAKAMDDYKSGARENKTMKAIANKLSEEDIANLAAYYASMK